MTSKGHKKHAGLARPLFGNFGRNEWAMLGTHCDNIKLVADTLIAALSRGFKCAYVDSSHHPTDATELGRIAAGANMEFTEHDTYWQRNYNGPFNEKDRLSAFAGCDVVLVNGNHHSALRQIVFIDPKKQESLQRRKDRLTHIDLCILMPGADDLFAFVKDALPNGSNVPTIRFENTGDWIAAMVELCTLTIPCLNGLVLAGGQSTRMGFDKGGIDWHGKPQRDYMLELLSSKCKATYLSCRENVAPAPHPPERTITDTFTGLGPYGALLSAFRTDPNAAWLVVACDLPLLDEPVLDHLVKHRLPRATATAYQSPHDDLPEPLIAIWEPKSYPLLLSYLALGISCPRKVLMNSDAHIILPINPDALTNVNTPEELEKVKAKLAKP